MTGEFPFDLAPVDLASPIAADRSASGAGLRFIVYCSRSRWPWKSNDFERLAEASRRRKRGARGHGAPAQGCEALAGDPKMKALIVHGYDDLSCPYFGSMLVVAQIPAIGDPGRLQVKA